MEVAAQCNRRTASDIGVRAVAEPVRMFVHGDAVWIAS
jgi:hypothetical protein